MGDLVRVRRPEFRNTLIVNAVYVVVVPFAAFTFMKLHHQPPALVFRYVFGYLAGLFGVFAQIYLALSLRSPDAFSSPLTRVEAAYFTISTATSTGMGDIHPMSSTARLAVTGQMVLSLFLVFAVLSVAFQRLFTPRSE